MARAIRATRHPDVSVRHTAAAVLASKRDSAATRALLRLVNDEDAHTRSMALRGVADSRSKAVMTALIDALSDSHSDVRYEAANGLAARECPQAFDALAKAFETEENPKLVNRLIAALARTGNVRAVPLLKSVLINQFHYEDAIKALSRLPHRQAVQTLAAQVDVPGHREKALDALSSHPHIAALEALVDALKREEGSRKPNPTKSWELCNAIALTGRLYHDKEWQTQTPARQLALALRHLPLKDGQFTDPAHLVRKVLPRFFHSNPNQRLRTNAQAKLFLQQVRDGLNSDRVK